VKKFDAPWGILEKALPRAKEKKEHAIGGSRGDLRKGRFSYPRGKVCPKKRGP